MKMELTAERKSQLNDVQAKVNKDTTYVTDQKNYGVPEYWAVAQGKGDCEDFALAKMKMLRSLGWPKETLDVAICLVSGQGHAVLIAHTSEGDYVLDNNQAHPIIWNDLVDYKWLEVSTNGNFGLNDWRSIET